jgi:hypothetical protein
MAAPASPPACPRRHPREVRRRTFPQIMRNAMNERICGAKLRGLRCRCSFRQFPSAPVAIARRPAIAPTDNDQLQQGAAR